MGRKVTLLVIFRCGCHSRVLRRPAPRALGLHVCVIWGNFYLRRLESAVSGKRRWLRPLPGTARFTFPAPANRRPPVLQDEHPFFYGCHSRLCDSIK